MQLHCNYCIFYYFCSQNMLGLNIILQRININQVRITNVFTVSEISYSDNYNDFMLRYGHGSSG